MEELSLTQQIRRARGKFLAMAATYSLGVFNDNFFRQAAMLMAVALGKKELQGHAIVIFALPYLIFAAYAGWFADRFSKRNVVIWAKVLELAAMICGAIGICLVSWPLIMTMVGLMGLQSCFFNPALNGSIPELYPTSYVTTANAYLKVVVTAAILAGYALAGVALDREGMAWGSVELGHATVAGAVLLVAALGVIGSFGVPHRPAAAPEARFPLDGPLHTLRDLWAIRKDGLLAVVIAANAFVWFAGALELSLINELGKIQLGLSMKMTSGLLAAQLVGLAMGGLLSSRLAKGERWYRILPPAGFVMAGLMMLMGLAPSLGAAMPDRMIHLSGHTVPLELLVQVGACFALLFCIGMGGGMYIIPCEAFVQVRPAADRKGRVIAASTFAVFVGILLSGPVYNLLTSQWGLLPTTAFAVLGAMSFLVAAFLGLALTRPGNAVLDTTLRNAIKFLLGLRYRVRVKGLKTVAARGRKGILFLPNHPGLIDPIIVATYLNKDFRPRFLADQDQVDRPVIRTLARYIGARTIPDLARYGSAGRERIEAMISDCIEGLREGENLVMYPAGHIYRQWLEDLRGNSGVETILRECPDVRVVLVRTRGIWGSRFSWASGETPNVAATLKRAVRDLFLSGVFLAPKREVDIELVEPDDVPRTADRETLNRYLEDFYNVGARHNTHVPYTIWEKGGIRELPEPERPRVEGDVGDVPDATREIVVSHLSEISGVSRVTDESHLARDLGLDSLARAELIVWLESEFGLPAGDADTLQAVSDVLLAACGRAVSSGPAALKPIAAAWFRDEADAPVAPMPAGANIAEVFLAQAARAPGRAAIADQTSGVKTWRDVVASVMALRPHIASLPGSCVGLMMPAGVVADILYLAAMFAGKTPVMVNWTVGARNMTHSLDLVGVEKVLTANALASRLGTQGVDLEPIRERLVYLEDVGKRIGLAQKLSAFIRSRTSWESLRRAEISRTAAILFTSGSESLPKAVPLTHENILANVRAVTEVVRLRANDRLIGILPPFHSFGLTTSVVLPLCLGIRVAYHPNPTEAPMLGRLIEAYRCTLLMGTPTFLNGIVRASTTERLKGLRLAVTGAEKCPDRVYEALAERCPNTTVLEGYGVTECSPIISVNEEKSPKRGTIGKALPNLDYAIVDVEKDRRVKPGEPGMLLVRGPSVFGGYVKYDGPSPFVDFEGKRWYRTGDLVREDTDGVLSFAGRLKRFVKLGGEMVSLPAIESVLEAHYATEDDEKPVVAVEATPSEDHPEIVLFTTRDTDREAANQCIRDAGLSPIHNIRRVIRVQEIPLLGTGKTDYRALKARLS